MNIWCLSFLIAALAGIVGVPPPHIFFAMFVLAFLFFLTDKKPSVVVFILMGWGCLWGMYGHAPKFAPADGGTVVATARQNAESMFLIVETPQGRIAADGLAAVGQAGIVSCKTQIGILGDRRCSFSPHDFVPLSADWPDYVSEWTAPVKSRFWRGWLNALLFGRSQELSPKIKGMFIDTGLYHLLIVSGLHVNIIGLVIPWLIRQPFQLMYALRLIGPLAWIRIYPLFTLAGLFGTFCYLLVTGSAAPGQRSFLVHAVALLCPLFIGPIPAHRRLSLAAFLQMLLFPVGFLGVGTILSWSAYLLIYPTERFGRAPVSFIKKIMNHLEIQAWLSLLLFGLIGNLTPFSLIANLCITPLFPLLFAMAVASLAASWWVPIWAPMLFAIQQRGLDIISIMSDISLQYSGVINVDTGYGAALVRVGAIASASVIILERLTTLRVMNGRSLDWQADSRR